MPQLPLFYYPTTLYWIDDDGLFLTIAAERFKADFTLKTSCSPQETIDFFANYQSSINPLTFLRGCEEHEDYDLTDHLPVDLDFSKVRQVQNNAEKIQEMAVMIVDYRMPQMSGIELCKQLSATATKKILLTGDADFPDAINAFNDGIIHYFVCKDDPRIDTILSENVARLSREYFIERTNPLLYHIESDYHIPQSDPVFTHAFTALCKKQNIKEYYLSDKNGGILMLDAQGRSHYLVIHTDRTLNNFVELNAINNEVIFFVKSIRDRRKIPFFGVGKEMWNLETTTWSNHFYTPTVWQGRETYYWALVPL